MNIGKERRKIREAVVCCGCRCCERCVCKYYLTRFSSAGTCPVISGWLKWAQFVSMICNPWPNLETVCSSEIPGAWCTARSRRRSRSGADFERTVSPSLTARSPLLSREHCRNFGTRELKARYSRVDHAGDDCTERGRGYRYWRDHFITRISS